MRRWLRLSIAAIALVALLAACGGGEEEGETPTATPSATVAGTVRPTATPARTGTPAVTATSAATTTVTALPSTPTPTVVAETPTAEAPAPTPEPTEEIRQPVWTVSQVSKEAAVDITLEDGLGHTYTVASVDPEVVQWENWGVQFAADLDADGVGDVLVFHFTGGAHCCFEYLAFRETSAGIELDHWFSLGNGGIGGVEDLDGDGIPELEGFDDRLAYFPDLSYAASPTLPLVLCRTGDGSYADCTVLFPDRMQAAADEFEASLSDAVQRQASDEEKRSYALGLVTAYLLLAPTDEGWNKVASLCPECKDWLLQNQAELENRLAYVPPAPPMAAPQ